MKALGTSPTMARYLMECHHETAQQFFGMMSNAEAVLDACELHLAESGQVVSLVRPALVSETRSHKGGF